MKAITSKQSSKCILCKHVNSTAMHDRKSAALQRMTESQQHCLHQHELLLRKLYQRIGQQVLNISLQSLILMQEALGVLGLSLHPMHTNLPAIKLLDLSAWFLPYVWCIYWYPSMTSNRSSTGNAECVDIRPAQSNRQHLIKQSG